MDSSLHIALCDSSPGDRKQMERLLDRESDKRVNTTGVFYIDTFGSVEAILKAALVYDVYFLDSTDPLCDSYEIGKAIRNKGILSPIVFCISTIDYRNSGEILPNSVFINKPIKVSELTLILDEIIRQRIEDHIPTIELRSSYESYYVTEKDIMYFTGRDFAITVKYVDGKERMATSSFDGLAGDTEIFSSFVKISKDAIINKNCIESVGINSVTMADGHVFKMGLRQAKLLKASL